MVIQFAVDPVIALINTEETTEASDTFKVPSDVPVSEMVFGYQWYRKSDLPFSQESGHFPQG